VQGDGETKQTRCSTEHNIDTYPSSVSAGLTATGRHAKAQVALGFVRARDRSAATSGPAPSRRTDQHVDPPEDVNTWGYLAVGGHTYAAALD
jgi:hypothetical protein